MSPILIISAGNALAGDDAIGPLVLEELRRRAPGLDLLDVSTAPLSLLGELENRQAVGIVDAALSSDEPPGQIIACDWLDPTRPAIASERAVSTHGLGLSTALDLAHSLDQLPPATRLFAITIGQSALGAPLSEAVRRAIPDVVERIVEWAKAVGAER